MQKISKTVEVFSFDELSTEAKRKAIEDYNQFDDLPFLQDDLREYIHEELKDRDIEELSEITPLYSLSYCQGDGLMFEGKLGYKDYVITAKHHGHYYHNKSVTFDFENESDDNEETRYTDNDEFIAIYEDICDIVAKRGYDIIEYNQSEEYFSELCEANEYNFTKDGKMVNESDTDIITDKTLGALLSSKNNIVKRNATSILKQLQK